MIYITSDWHFCHNRPFLYEARGFKNVYDMNEAIIKNHNLIVQPEDDVYVLGDLMLNDNIIGSKCIHQLKGRIHVCLGNHDTEVREELYRECYNIVEVALAYRLKYMGYHFFLSHYPMLTANYDDKYLKQMCISLCGHSHTKDKFQDLNKGLIYHCEVDAHNCYPIPLDKIIEDLKEKRNGR